MVRSGLRDWVNAPPLVSSLVVALVFGLIGALIHLPNQPEHELHLFISSHYARSFFDLYDARWYGGFSIGGHPPLLHMATAVLSFVPGLGVDRAYALVLAAIPVLLTISAWRYGGERFALLMALNPAALLLLVPLGQTPFVLCVALGLAAAAMLREGATVSGAALALASACTHPLGLLVPAVLGVRSLRAALAVSVAGAVAAVILWPFFSLYVNGGIRALPAVTLSLDGGDRFAAILAIVLAGTALLLVVKREARWPAAAALVLVLLARVGVGPVYWDKLLVYAAIALGLALVRSSLGLSALVVVLFFAGAQAIAVKKPNRTRDQRPAFAAIIELLNRDGQERFRFVTLGFGKEQLELGRRVRPTTVDGAMPWLRTLLELEGYLSIDELPLDTAGGQAALKALLARADALHLAVVLSADANATPLLLDAGYQSLAAFAGNVVVFTKDVPPIPDAPPPSQPAPLWSFGTLFVMAGGIASYRRVVMSKLSM